MSDDIKSVSDILGSAEPALGLEEIEGQPVVVTAVEHYTFEGDDGTPIEAVRIRLTDGRVVRSSGSQVVQRMTSLPADAFPIRATFSSAQSRKNPRRRYWTVE